MGCTGKREPMKGYTSIGARVAVCVGIDASVDLDAIRAAHATHAYTRLDSVRARAARSDTYAQTCLRAH